VADLQPLYQPMQRLRGARDLAQEAHFAAPARLGDRYRGHSLVHVQLDERDRFHAARLLCLRLGAGQSGATLDYGIPETGPSAQRANIGSNALVKNALQRGCVVYPSIWTRGCGLGRRYRDAFNIATLRSQALK
jgi:hypothetical protein